MSAWTIVAAEVPLQMSKQARHCDDWVEKALCMLLQAATLAKDTPDTSSGMHHVDKNSLMCRYCKLAYNRPDAAIKHEAEHVIMCSLHVTCVTMPMCVYKQASTSAY